MKNGGGDSCVTVIMNDTLVNTTWVRNLILAYDSVLHAQYADSSKFADTSAFAISIVLASSDGEILYDNSGTIDGAPMTTDGTNITITNDVSAGGAISSSYASYPIFQAFLVDLAEFSFSWADIANSDLVSLIVEPTTPYSFTLETDWNDIHHQMVFDNRTTSPRMFYQLITYDQLESHGFLVDTNSFDIFIAYPGSGDPQYSFREDSALFNVSISTNDTILMINSNMIVNADSAYITDKSWDWLYNLGKP